MCHFVSNIALWNPTDNPCVASQLSYSLTKELSPVPGTYASRTHDEDFVEPVFHHFLFCNCHYFLLMRVPGIAETDVSK